ncbi:hypothetical protein PVAG01_10333 [Phlyctema vagabunda]|uniref:Zn(2)-C6 fungal-type domain-containing protein n=1 Tax=Phlyctema vagabunda TaxID=108571 RepID=A0ABR4P5S9_9HELO
MVNTGKPSKGCYLCRARRIKCDETKPACLRCQKSKRICPGYRDSFELSLRDETKSTKRKASKTFSPSEEDIHNVIMHHAGNNGEHLMLYSDSQSATVPAWANYIGDTSPDHLSHIYNTVSGLHTPLNYQYSRPRDSQLTVDEQAFGQFLSKFVLIPEQGATRGFFDFLVPLLKAEQAGSPLSTAFSAVALAAFGVRPFSKSLLPQADALYVRALKQINSVLQHPKLALEDSTLATVLLLGFYEARAILSDEQYWQSVLTSSQTLTSSQLTVKGWISHIEGAVALLKSRGKQQMETQIGRELFMAIRSQMMVVGIANSKYIDGGIDSWMNMGTEDATLRRINELNLRVAGLRADSNAVICLSSRTANNLEKVLRLLREGEALEQAFGECFDNLPEFWKPQTVSWVDRIPDEELPTSSCYPGKVDIYSEIWLASQYVNGLSSRLFVSSTILRCTAWLCSPLDYRITPEYTAAARLSGQIIEDIVASVPYFFGLHSNACVESQLPCDEDRTSTPKVLAGVFSLWPVFVAATCDFATETQRIWLRVKLQEIAESMGVNHSALLIQASHLRYPSMFIHRDTMNLPLSNSKVPTVLQLSPTISESSISSSTYPEPIDESIWHLKLSEAHTLQTSHAMNMTSGSENQQYSNFISS